MRLCGRAALCVAGGALMLIMLLARATLTSVTSPRGGPLQTAQLTSGLVFDQQTVPESSVKAPENLIQQARELKPKQDAPTDPSRPDALSPLSVIDNIIPADDILMNMSHRDLELLYHSYVNSPQVTCNSVLRMGLITDGGWEHCDDPRFTPDRRDCLVYSYGINFDFSYDDDMAKFGCEVHSFDPSMNTMSHKRGERVHFHSTGVAARDQVASHMGEKRDQTWQLYSMASDRKRLNHTRMQRRVDVMKMDVEGYELEALLPALQAGALDDVRQLNFESHVGMSATADPTKEQYIQFLQMFRTVYDYGFRIYLTHRNYMWSAFGSYLFPGKKRVKCHEVHTVNINIINPDWKKRYEDQQKLQQLGTPQLYREQRNEETVQNQQQNQIFSVQQSVQDSFHQAQQYQQNTQNNQQSINDYKNQMGLNPKLVGQLEELRQQFAQQRQQEQQLQQQLQTHQIKHHKTLN